MWKNVYAFQNVALCHISLFNLKLTDSFLKQSFAQKSTDTTGILMNYKVGHNVVWATMWFGVCAILFTLTITAVSDVPSGFETHYKKKVSLFVNKSSVLSNITQSEMY